MLATYSHKYKEIRNKKSAQCSRQRKKEYVEELERKYAAILHENDELHQIVAKLNHQIESLSASYRSQQQLLLGIRLIVLDVADLGNAQDLSSSQAIPE